MRWERGEEDREGDQAAEQAGASRQGCKLGFILSVVEVPRPISVFKRSLWQPRGE